MTDYGNPDSTITVNGQEFGLSGWESKCGKVFKAVYFATDRSNLKIEIDYTYTAKGCL